MINISELKKGKIFKFCYSNSFIVLLLSDAFKNDKKYDYISFIILDDTQPEFIGSVHLKWYLTRDDLECLKEIKYVEEE